MLRVDTNKILVALVLVLLLVLGVVIYLQVFSREAPYYAVYLTTGDLYFGKLETFPGLALTDVWYIQRNPQDSKNPASLAKFANVFWGPGDKLYLEKDKIIWKAQLRDDSPVLAAIKNPQLLQQPLSQNPPSAQEGAMSQQPGPPMPGPLKQQNPGNK